MGTALVTKEHSVYRYIQPPTSLPHLHLHQLDYSEDLRRVKDCRKATSTTLEVYWSFPFNYGRGIEVGGSSIENQRRWPSVVPFVFLVSAQSPYYAGRYSLGVLFSCYIQAYFDLFWPVVPRYLRIWCGTTIERFTFRCTTSTALKSPAGQGG